MSEDLPRLDALIGDSWDIIPFSDLDLPHQMAIAWYMAVDGEIWGDGVLEDLYESPDVPSQGDDPAGWHAFWKTAIRERMPLFVEQVGDQMFGVVQLATADVVRSVGGDEEFVGMADAEVLEAVSGHFHDAYPPHSTTDRWPVILSSDDSQTLQDGWHRFGNYVASGEGMIPAVFYPADRHIESYERRALSI